MATNPYTLDLSGLSQGLQLAGQLGGLKDVRLQREQMAQQAEQQQALHGLLSQTDLTDPQQALALQQQFPGQLEQLQDQQQFALDQLQIDEDYKAQASAEEKRAVNRAANTMLFASKTGDADSMVASVRNNACLLYTSPSPRDRTRSRMPSSA